MAHMCFTKFPPLLKEKFLLQEVALMYRKDEAKLKTDAAKTLRQIQTLATGNKFEVRKHFHIVLAYRW